MRAMAFALAMALAAPAVAQPAAVRLGAWEQFEIWERAIHTHAPGENDDALRAVLGLSAQEIESIVPYMVFTLREAFRQQQRRTARFDEFFDKYGTRSHEPGPDVPIKDAAARIVDADLDRFLKRAAMLHADVGFRFPNAHQSSAAGLSHLVADGRNEGDRGRTWNWMLGRGFLHLVFRKEEDPFVRLWYQAVANSLMTRGNFAESGPHLDRGLQLFPRDPELLFARGWHHEAHAGPVIQAAITERLQAMPPRERQAYLPEVKGRRVEEAFALDAYQKAVDGDPSHVEARIRLGRMLTLAGKPSDAVPHLREALRLSADPVQQYIAHLFLGAAEAARGDHAAARASYEAASALQPGAQSPRIAIAQLDLHAGDRDASARLFAVLAAPSTVEDPWWDYHSTRVPAPGVWFARLREALRAEVR